MSPISRALRTSTTCWPACRALGPEFAALADRAAGLVEEDLGRADRDPLERRQPRPALLHLAVGQLPNAAQQDAVGARQRLHAVGQPVRPDDLEAHVPGGAGRDHGWAPLQLERRQAPQDLQPAEPRQGHGDDGGEAAPAGQRLERGAPVADDVDAELAPQRVRDRAQPLRLRVREEHGPRPRWGGSGEIRLGRQRRRAPGLLPRGRAADASLDR
jgi:hypothetical protein